MLDLNEKSFPTLNRAFGRVFQPGLLTIGLVAPIEEHGQNPVATMERHIDRAQLADHLGFAALWLRDVPFNVPSFGDAGQLYDPFVYLGLLSGVTRDIALGVSSIILPLRHPAHVAKAAASADQLSGGRLLLGVASGDRPEEYPAMGKSFADRSLKFRESLSYLQSAALTYPKHTSAYGNLDGRVDMLPKPAGDRLPILITGSSQQSPDWVAQNGDGWMTYPRDIATQARVVSDYRARSQTAGSALKPVMQSLYIDLVEDPDAPPQPIHLGFRSGMSYLKSYLNALQSSGINHVALNLRFNHRDVEDTMNTLADQLLPFFPTQGASQ